MSSDLNPLPESRRKEPMPSVRVREVGKDIPSRRQEGMAYERARNANVDLTDGALTVEQIAKKNFLRKLLIGGSSLLLVLALVGILVVSNRDALSQKVLSDQALEVPLKVGPAQYSIEANFTAFWLSRNPVEIDKEVEKSLRGFMNATTMEERMEWLWPADGLEERVDEYLSREDIAGITGFESVTSSELVAFEGVPLQIVVAEEKNTGKRYPFNLVAGDDRMLIDWDSSVVYGEMTWDQFVEKRPLVPIQMRVFLNPDSYYNYQFADEERYACFLTYHRDPQNYLYVYLERDSEVYRKLKRALDVEAGNRLPAKVRLKFVPNVEDERMLLMTDFIHPFWLQVGASEVAVSE